MEIFWDGPLPEPGERTFDEMRCVLANPGCTIDYPLYFMYRDLARRDSDREWLSSHNLRYDMTVIPPGVICGEYVKTKGHYHPASPGGVGFPEIYQVIEGTAHYLLQHRELDDVVVITAKPGEQVIVPPDYGHVTINPSNRKLVMANIVSTAFSSEYKFYENMHGASYYECNEHKWVKNPNYDNIPPIRFIEPPEIPELYIRHGIPLYDLVGKDECFAYLNRPEKYLELFRL